MKLVTTLNYPPTFYEALVTSLNHFLFPLPDLPVVTYKTGRVGLPGYFRVIIVSDPITRLAKRGRVWV
jgi:hypothetical protein